MHYDALQRRDTHTTEFVEQTSYGPSATLLP